MRALPSSRPRRGALGPLLCLTAAVAGCGDGGPSAPASNVVLYRLDADSALVVDSIHFRSPFGGLGSAAPPLSPGWTIAIERPPGDTIEAFAWMTAAGPGTAVLRASWEGRHGVATDSAQIVAVAPGPVALHLTPQVAR